MVFEKLIKEIIKTLSLREYLTAFLEKGLRYDKRALDSKRSYSYLSGILETLQFSASCTLGSSNKILSVFKMKHIDNKHSKISKRYLILDIVLENTCDGSVVDSSILSFINKIIDHNTEILDLTYEYTLYIKIINNDGNIYDCIGHLLVNLFSKDNKVVMFYLVCYIEEKHED
jgi:exosome complex RNA-binding protein Rrp42 (RNase PH superfamily)